MKERKVMQVVQGISAVDGAGVHLTRVLSHSTVKAFDPFLMLLYGLGVILGPAHMLLFINVIQIIKMLAAGLVWNTVQLGRTMSRRVEESTRIAERVRDGDLATPVTDREHDEFSPLLRALQEMQASLTQIVSGVRGSAETVAQASNQIAEGNNDLSRRTEDQASALQQTAATMDELSNTVRTNTGHAQEATRLAQDAVQI